MGNIEKNLQSYIQNLYSFIEKEDYEGSKKLFDKYEKELEKYKSEEERKKIISCLMEYLEPNFVYELEIYMTNLNPKDKIYLLFKEIYEKKLVESGQFKFLDLKDEKIINNYIEKMRKFLKILI